MSKTAPREYRGTAQPFKDANGRTYWRARATLPDGKRVWVGPRFTGKHGEQRAREKADEETRKAFAKNLTLDAMKPQSPAAEAHHGGETCDEWHERYLEACKARGIATVGDKGYRWGKYVSPTLGSKRPCDVTRDDVEDVRNQLDENVRAGRMSWKTAANAWGEMTVSFREMCSSKRRDLRVIETNPTNGVQPPDTGANKSKVYPYPSELLAVLSCDETRVPLAWKELHAIAAYTYLRPGELHVLEWSDVDLHDQKIHVTKAWDYKSKRVKSTKTEEMRSLPIEANLLPLLRHMKERADGKGLVVPILSQTHPDEVAEKTREHFLAAGCVRSRLYARSSSERRVVFRSWRDAGITWSIVRGDDVVRTQRRAGHKLISTTMRYVVEAENRGASFGVPFPPLPPSMLGLPKTLPKEPGGKLQATVIAHQSMCERRELNPHESYLART